VIKASDFTENGVGAAGGRPEGFRHCPVQTEAAGRSSRGARPGFAGATSPAASWHGA
jgi:hypothetical protein